MVLLGASCLVLIQVSVDGSFPRRPVPRHGRRLRRGLDRLARRVAGQHSGAASGLQTTSFKHGHRGRVAVLSTVAVAWTNDVLAAADQQAPSPFALTEGYQSGRAGTHDTVSAPTPGATRPTHERGQGDRHEGSDR
jgi:hypothetical protein